MWPCRERKSVTKALIDGKIVVYDAMSSTSSTAYPTDRYQYLGEGILHSTDGALWHSQPKGHFFKEIKK